MVEHFNTFFTIVGYILLEVLPLPTGRFGQKFVTTFSRKLNMNQNVLDFSRTTYDGVYKILAGMNSRVSGLGT